MRKDHNGCFYFIDRIGDTLRWKGENVSTTEVSEMIMMFPGVKETAVYGVQIPATDGRAGMAAVVVDGVFDLAKFANFLQTQLPHYAQPVFLRICLQIDATVTFKQSKANLERQGYDPTVTEDRVYVKDRKNQYFVRIDAALHESIQKGELQF